MSIIWLNGAYVEGDETHISHRDSGFTTGIGIFDSMLVKDGAPVYLSDHFARIMHDADMVVGLTPAWNDAVYTKIVQNLLKKNNLREGFARIRTVVTGGVVSAPLMATKNPTVLIDAAAASDPGDIKAATCWIAWDFPRVAGNPLYNCKRLDYSESYAARRQAEKNGANEAIIPNTEGNIACGATSNIFIREGDQLITPPLRDGVLAGVTRKHIIADKKAREESISEMRLMAADAVYLTNSFVGLRQISAINGKNFSL